MGEGQEGGETPSCQRIPSFFTLQGFSKTPYPDIMGKNRGYEFRLCHVSEFFVLQQERPENYLLQYLRDIFYML